MTRPLSTRKYRRRLEILSAAMLGVGATAVGSVAAMASEDPNEPPLSVASNGTTFFTQEGVTAYWDGWVAAFPVPLPVGINLPAEPTAYFDLNDGQEHLFQEGLPEAILSRFARCAWLGVALDEQATSERSEANVQLARYAEYPGVAAGLDVDAYREEIDAAARDEGAEPTAFEYEIECGWFEEEIMEARP